MVDYRQERLGGQLRAELADLILNELRDPHVGFATITEVRLSADLRHARVYASVYGDDRQEAETIAALNHARGFLKREIGRRLRLRYIPELDFIADRTLKQSARIDALLEVSEPDDEG